MLFTLFTLWSERKQRIHVHVILSKLAPGWRREDKLLNKVVIFVFFAHKKYSRSFEKLWLNHWCHMDYFNDLLATFLSLDRVRILAVYGGSESSRNSSKNILICVPKMNEGLGTTWGWVINDRIFIFGWTIPLIMNTLVCSGKFYCLLHFVILLVMSLQRLMNRKSRSFTENDLLPCWKIRSSQVTFIYIALLTIQIVNTDGVLNRKIVCNNTKGHQ